MTARRTKSCSCQCWQHCIGAAASVASLRAMTCKLRWAVMGSRTDVQLYSANIPCNICWTLNAGTNRLELSHLQTCRLSLSRWLCTQSLHTEISWLQAVAHSNIWVPITFLRKHSCQLLPNGWPPGQLTHAIWRNASQAMSAVTCSNCCRISLLSALPSTSDKVTSLKELI